MELESPPFIMYINKIAVKNAPKLYTFKKGKHQWLAPQST